ncbi:MAG: UDP-N-acetylmuramoyl-tripeptide--D-alanyl-D-alanine ligase, partial [Clostridia bacterium]|nr:UDP-N-acetylmuramoyl-tripeptide--D-alanyl-D-alanine ligase [Clostridia bacterium]
MKEFISEAVWLLLGGIGAYLSLVRAFQMLQQNSYFASRYFGWIKSSFSPVNFIIRLVILGLIIAAAALGAETFTASMMLFSVLGIYFGWRGFSENEKSIKKLVFTARIKRMFIFALGFLALVGCVGLFLSGVSKTVLYALFYILLIVPETLCLFTLFALKPVEKSVANYYIKDAKKILGSHFSLKTVGVTGSFGKTGTKYILSRILSEKFNTLHTPESFNTPMGVVRTVRESMRADCEVFVSEMGAKKKGDIKEICDIVHPDFAIITSVGPQHLDTFGNIETVAATKFELADAVTDKGNIFANGDNEIIREKAKGTEINLYGTDPALPYRAENIRGDRSGATFDLVLKDERVSVQTKLLGRHNVLNIVGASALAYKMGVSPREIAFAVSRLSPVPHRLELKPYVCGSLVIDDAYNANPEGWLEAFNVLGSFEGMKKVIITPGLVELGEKEYECNKALGAAAAEVADIIILVGRERSVPLADGV